MRCELNPEVEDYFAVTNAAGVGAAFHANRIAVLEGFLSEGDLEIFQAVEIAQEDRQFQKLKPHEVILRLRDAPYTENPMRRFLPAWKVDAFADAWEKLQDRVKRMVNDAFDPQRNSRRLLGGSMRWRPAITRSYGLHLDISLDDRGKWVKVFVNLDSEPRIWHTSHRLTLIQEIWGDMPVEWGRNEQCRFLSLEQGDWLDALPKHRVEWGPGDLWLLDGSEISHEIVYGRNMASFSYHYKD